MSAQEPPAGHQPDDAAPPLTAGIEDDSVGISGPSAAAIGPQAGQVLTPRGAGLPIREVSEAADLWVVGAHGGAGETTLAAIDDAARWIGPTWKGTDHAWPTSSGPGVCRCVLVARTHERGLRAAQAALTQWASGELGPSTDLLGLVLIADAPGRLPRPLRDLAALVAGGAPRTWRLGWIEAWRTGELPPRAQLPKDHRTLMTELASLTTS